MGYEVNRFFSFLKPKQENKKIVFEIKMENISTNKEFMAEFFSMVPNIETFIKDNFSLFSGFRLIYEKNKLIVFSELTQEEPNKTYDENNVFFKIIKENDSEIIKERSKHFVSIDDIFPNNEFHRLIIPKSNYIDILDFSKRSSEEEQQDFFCILEEVLLKKGSLPLSSILANTGRLNWQAVMHFHVHVRAGKKIR